MKTLFPVLTFGVLGHAQGLNPEAVFTDSSKITSVNGAISISVAAGSEIYCEKAYDLGTAANYYTDFVRNGSSVVPPGLEEYAKDTQLAYKCGVRDTATGDPIKFQGPPLLFDSFSSDDKILVKFFGTCQTNSVEFGNSSVTNLGSYSGTQLYNASVTSSIKYGCRQAQDAFGGVTASLSLEVLSDAASFVQNVKFSDQLKFTSTTDGMTFAVQDAPLSFDLGTEKPHFSYYTALKSCQSQLCKGSLVLQSGQAKKTLVTDVMEASLMNKADKQVFKACSNTVTLSDERVYTNQEACYGPDAKLEDVLETAAGNLLDNLECPFSTEDRTSAPSDLQACFSSESTFDNTCEASLLRVGQDETKLGQVYTAFLTQQPGHATNRSFTYQFLDTQTGPEKRFESVADVDLTPEVIFLEPDDYQFDVTLNLGVNQTFTEINEKVTGVKLVDSTSGWSAFVSLTGTQIHLSGVPKIVSQIDLVGNVRTGCQTEEKSLIGGAQPLIKNIIGGASGEFKQVDPCQDLFLFHRNSVVQQDVNVTGAAGIARLQNTAVRICGTHTAGCETSTDVTIPGGSSSDIFAHIAGACNYVRTLGKDNSGVDVQETVYVSDGDTVGYVLLDQTGGAITNAPIKCAGFCRSSVVRLPDLSLDWEVEFEVSQTDHNLVADQDDAAYNDFKFDDAGHRNYDLTKTAYLAKTTDSVCQASGDISGDIPTSGVAPSGCLVYSDASEDDGSFDLSSATVFSNINSANDMIAWLTACGAPLADGSGAKAQLVQQFKVDYGDFDRGGLPTEESFCHTNDLTLFIQKKVIGVSSASLAVSEVIGAAASSQIGAAIGNFAFEECVGGYKLVASVDLIYQDSAITQPFTFDAAGSDFTGSLLAGSKVVQWSSSCRDVCADDAVYLTSWTNETKSLVASLESGDLQANLAFEVQMKGSPCSDEESFDGSGTVSLDLYTAEGDSCNATDTRLNKSPKADEKLCAHIKYNHEGAFELKLTQTQVTRKAQGGLAQVLCEETGDALCIGDARGKLFQVGKTLNASDSEATSSGIFALEKDDAFSDITYVVFWEQNYKGGARRLRSVHTFGAGETSSTASVTVLPVSAQIGEAVDSGDTLDILDIQQDIAASTPSSSSQNKTGMAAWSEEARIGFWIGMSVLAILVLLGLYSKQRHDSYTQSFSNLSQGKAPLRPDGYISVRRSERFSTSYF